ncbi:MAG: hypothetical protein U5J62_08005 [Desulfurivibrio sp.]|nr:hypothetical protein [Desulfurivibrio sp.]
MAADTGLEVVIVRPPLVYGPGVGGNFRRLLRLVPGRAGRCPWQWWTTPFTGGAGQSA